MRERRKSGVEAKDVQAVADPFLFAEYLILKLLYLDPQLR